MLHLDLKPSNVLLTKDGAPKIADFGIAKQLDTETDQTPNDEIAGTPAYMAPEQAERSSTNIGPATDIYGLGAILYQCLTGAPPFKAKTKRETLELVRNAQPLRPTSLRKGLSKDIEAVCLKCLAKEPRDAMPPQDNWKRTSLACLKTGPRDMLGRCPGMLMDGEWSFGTAEKQLPQLFYSRWRPWERSITY